MSRSVRLVVFAVGCLGLALLLAPAFAAIPDFGASNHPYRDRAVSAAVARATANAVSSVNYDQRALDTFGEETILFTSVIGATALLRTVRHERRRRPPDPILVLPSTRLVGYLLVPVTLVLGIDIVVHGHLTPGGGFQGGVVVATGLHLLYVAGSYPALRQLRPLTWYEYAEATGVGGAAALGLAALLTGSGLLANFLPRGTMGDLASAGTVVVLNVAVGLAVASGVIVLLAQFLEADVTRSRR